MHSLCGRLLCVISRVHVWFWAVQSVSRLPSVLWSDLF
jgi:hypothetical protein